MRMSVLAWVAEFSLLQVKRIKRASVASLSKPREPRPSLTPRKGLRGEAGANGPDFVSLGFRVAGSTRASAPKRTARCLP